MQRLANLALTGYNGRHVKSAMEKIVNESRSLNVKIIEGPKKHEKLLKNQPELRGCDHNDLTIFSL